MNKNEVQQGMEFSKDEVRQTLSMLVYYFITKDCGCIRGINCQEIIMSQKLKWNIFGCKFEDHCKVVTAVTQQTQDTDFCQQGT